MLPRKCHFLPRKWASTPSTFSVWCDSVVKAVCSTRFSFLNLVTDTVHTLQTELAGSHFQTPKQVSSDVPLHLETALTSTTVSTDDVQIKQYNKRLWKAAEIIWCHFLYFLFMAKCYQHCRNLTDFWKCQENAVHVLSLTIKYVVWRKIQIWINSLY